MTIVAARNFQLALMKNENLSAQLVQAEGPDAAWQLAHAEVGEFSQGEFEEAHRGLLVNCQHESQAEQLQVVRLLWELAVSARVQKRASEGSGCSGSCCG